MAEAAETLDHAIEHAVARAIAPPSSLTRDILMAAKALCGAPGEAQSCLCKLGMPKHCFAMRLHGGGAMAVVLAFRRMAAKA